MPPVRPRLLLVDDDEHVRRAFASFLGMTFEVVEATSGADAIEKLEHGSFAAILTDLVMPRIDGTQIVRWIATHRPTLSNCTFVITGGATDARLEQWLAEFDATRIFSKPCSPSFLVARIREAIESSRAMG